MSFYQGVCLLEELRSGWYKAKGVETCGNGHKPESNVKTMRDIYRRLERLDTDQSNNTSIYYDHIYVNQ